MCVDARRVDTQPKCFAFLEGKIGTTYHNERPKLIFYAFPMIVL